MDAREALLALAAVQGALVALLVVALLLHAGWNAERARRRAVRMEAVRGPLHAALAGGPTPNPLGRLPMRDRVRLLASLAPVLEGERRRRLATLAAEAGVVARADRLARSRLWWRRLRGLRLRLLTGGSPPNLHALLSDREAPVRAAAAALAGRLAEAQHADALARLVSDRDAGVRAAAEDALRRLGEAAIPSVAALLREGPTRRAALRIAAAVPSPRLLPDLLAHARDPEPAVRDAACRALAAIGGPQARAALLVLARDPSARVRAGAAEGLAATKDPEAAAPLARLLGDASFRVRRAAALGLARLGAAGPLALRAVVEEAEEPAASAARHALDLAAVEGHA